MAFASLSSGLLARKGQARPAMRPQGFDPAQGPRAPLDDLGWNDMGDRAAPAEPTPPAPLLAVPAAPEPVAPDPVASAPAAAAPVAAEPEPGPVAPPMPAPIGHVTRLPVMRAVAGSKGKSAFTLRLDPVRHLRLRLACALHHRSAQSVVTEALDRFLSSAELDGLQREAEQAVRPNRS